ncbi:hypothetical protein [Yeosuana sp.]|uniref:hypothetical protein n=1 Tax=Yeosuana sp. TaxID=2529388 RepID=UPI004054ADFE
METKYLFEKSSEDKRIYNLNQGYWKRKLQSRLKEKFSNENILFRNVDGKGNKIYDANPIFTFINYSKTKAIRIIQDDVKLIDNSQIYFDSYMISAWFDKIQFYESEKQINKDGIDELVIALFLTRKTVDKTMDLIFEWLNDNLDENKLNLIMKE